MTYRVFKTCMCLAELIRNYLKSLWLKGKLFFLLKVSERAPQLGVHSRLSVCGSSALLALAEVRGRSCNMAFLQFGEREGKLTPSLGVCMGQGGENCALP